MPIPFTCPHCGRQTDVLEQYAGQSGPCAGCGQMVTVPPLGGRPLPNIGDDPGIRLLLPVGRSGWAIAAGYAGLFSLVCFPAPLAVLLAIVAIRDLKLHPEKHGWGRAIFGLVMGILGTAGLALVAAGMLGRGMWF
jgi:hypothetical protein